MEIGDKVTVTGVITGVVKGLNSGMVYRVKFGDNEVYIHECDSEIKPVEVQK